MMESPQAKRPYHVSQYVSQKSLFFTSPLSASLLQKMEDLPNIQFMKDKLPTPSLYSSYKDRIIKAGKHHQAQPQSVPTIPTNNIPSVPHPHRSWTPPEIVIPPSPWAKDITTGFIVCWFSSLHSISNTTEALQRLTREFTLENAAFLGIYGHQRISSLLLFTSVHSLVYGQEKKKYQ